MIGTIIWGAIVFAAFYWSTAVWAKFNTKQYIVILIMMLLIGLGQWATNRLHEENLTECCVLLCEDMFSGMDVCVQAR